MRSFCRPYRACWWGRFDPGAAPRVPRALPRADSLLPLPGLQTSRDGDIFWLTGETFRNVEILGLRWRTSRSRCRCFEEKRGCIHPATQNSLALTGKWRNPRSWRRPCFWGGFDTWPDEDYSIAAYVPAVILSKGGISGPQTHSGAHPTWKKLPISARIWC